MPTQLTPDFRPWLPRTTRSCRKAALPTRPCSAPLSNGAASTFSTGSSPNRALALILVPVVAQLTGRALGTSMPNMPIGTSSTKRCARPSGERHGRLTIVHQPTREEQAIAAPAPASSAQTGTSAVIHTTLGDIHCRLFPDLAPKTVENFASLARNGYYAGVIFHRVIKKFVRSRFQAASPRG